MKTCWKCEREYKDEELTFVSGIGDVCFLCGLDFLIEGKRKEEGHKIITNGHLKEGEK